MSPSVTVEPSYDSISVSHLQEKKNFVPPILNNECVEERKDLSKSSKGPQTEEII